MSERVGVFIDVDSAAATAEIAAIKAKTDEVVRQWKIDRTILIQQIREAFTLISQLMSSFRQAMSLFGQQIDPFFSALIGMVFALTSMLISSAAVLKATILGAPVGAIIFGLAVAFNILTIGKLLADKEASDGIISNMIQTLAEGYERQKGTIGGFSI